MSDLPDQDVPPRAAAVLLAAGSGRRVGSSTNKVLLPLAGEPILVRSVRTVLDVATVQRVVLVVRAEDRDDVADAVAPHLGPHDVWIVEGGAERHDSEWAALRALAPDVETGEIDVVAVHDAARPLASAALWDEVVAQAHRHGGAIPVVASPRLSRRTGLVAPEGLVTVQTPQAFRAPELLMAYRLAQADGFAFAGTDTAACLGRYADLPVVGVPSGPENLKVTFPEDVALAEELLSPSAG